MTMHAHIIPPAPAGANPAAPPDSLALYGYAGAPSQRWDGWSAERQRVFLQAIAEGSCVTHACRIVGLSKQSAYAFRSSARGAGFALGWHAATLLSRDVLADELLERAMNGITDSIQHRDGTTDERHRHDNRLAMAMLTRMDRIADAGRGDPGFASARLVAQEFDQFLDLIGKDCGPARAGLFLGARLADGMAPAPEDDLAPIRALARADRWLRTRTDVAAPIDTADLDPAARADWTAEQWARAEAAGLLQLAAPPAPERGKDQRSQDLLDFADPDGPVWWDHGRDEWRTRFPPPEDFLGFEYGEYDEPDYSRTLSDAELASVEAPLAAETAEHRTAHAIERDIWFGFAEAPEDAADAPLAGDSPADAAAADPGSG